MLRKLCFRCDRVWVTWVARKSSPTELGWGGGGGDRTMFHKSTARVGRVPSFSNVTHEESRTWRDQTYKKKPGSATEEWVWDPETTDKLTTLNCKGPRGCATYVSFKEWGIGSQMMIEAHSSHLIFGLSVVQADIATSKAARTSRFLPSLVPTLQKVFVRQRPRPPFQPHQILC